MITKWPLFYPGLHFSTDRAHLLSYDSLCPSHCNWGWTRPDLSFPAFNSVVLTVHHYPYFPGAHTLSRKFLSGVFLGPFSTRLWKDPSVLTQKQPLFSSVSFPCFLFAASVFCPHYHKVSTDMGERRFPPSFMEIQLTYSNVCFRCTMWFDIRLNCKMITKVRLVNIT